MWRKQALLMGGGLVKDSDSLSQDKAKTKAVIGGERSSSYTSRNSTYFDTSVIQVRMPFISLEQSSLTISHEKSFSRQEVTTTAMRRNGHLKVLLIERKENISPPGLCEP